jgi:hypothetical protein
MVPWHSFLLESYILFGGCTSQPIGITSNLVESFFRDSWDTTPTATPYCSGIPIDAIAPSTEEDNSPTLKECEEAYQSLIGSIGWLSSTTCPDLMAVHSFLSSYNNKPSAGRMKAALYTPHYIPSTHDYGISFSSEDIAPMHLFIYFPRSTDVGAYEDAVPPKPVNSSTLSANSDVC